MCKISILVFDDRYIAREILCDELMDSFFGQINVVTCKDVFEANAIIKQSVFDVIIVDSMMSPLGLDDEQEKYTNEGLFTGVVWLCGLHNNQPEKLKNTLIYVFSGYLDDYEAKGTIDALNKYTHNDGFLNSINFISKAENNIEEIIKGIKEKFKLSECKWEL